MGVRMTSVLAPTIAIWSGENRPAPFERMLWHFPLGSWMVKFAPLMSQPRISFSYFQRPSCWISFLRDMESPPGWFVTDARGKMGSMPWIMALDVL
eukprot:263461-Ditylum_brightwellii.AAC.1